MDNIAYIRFASVYKDFRSLQDLNDFIATIEKLATPNTQETVEEN